MSAPSDRPLSPHLQIYRPQITSVLSITHRITGAGLVGGAVMAVWWLFSVSQGAAAYADFYRFAQSIVGQTLLLGWLWAMIYHTLNGVRHLFWDAGYGINIPAATKSGWMIVGGSVALTALVWFAKG